MFYVTYPSEKPWGSDFAAQGLKEHSKNTVRIINLNQLDAVKNSLIHIHNVQILHKKSYFPLKFLKKLQSRNNKVIVGLRGNLGMNRFNDLLRQADAISTGYDLNLVKYAEHYNTNVYRLPPGINTNIFKPIEVGKEYDLIWVGRSGKEFKNYSLLKELGYSYIAATYDNYIPHDQLPIKYCSSLVHVVFSDFEGYCRPIPEASLCNVPTISTDVGVASDILEYDHICKNPARLTPEFYKRWIEYYKQDPESANETGKRNHIKAQKYSWKNIAPLYDKFWKEVS